MFTVMHAVAMSQRVRPFRVGVVLDEDSAARMFLSVAASSDGGVIVWPRPVPTARWFFGPRGAPRRRARRAAGLDPPGRAGRHGPPTETPLHPSGWITANLTGEAAPRLPLRLLNGAEFFSCPAWQPARFAGGPAEEARSVRCRIANFPQPSTWRGSCSRARCSAGTCWTSFPPTNRWG